MNYTITAIADRKTVTNFTVLNREDASVGFMLVKPIQRIYTVVNAGRASETLQDQQARRQAFNFLKKF